jgi:hypothetical protein
MDFIFLADILLWMAIIIGFLVVVPTILCVFGLSFGLLRIVVVQEATAVAFKYLGQYAYCVMEFRGHHFDPNGSIISGLGANSIGSCWCIWRWGGWVFYIWPFVEPAKYADYNNPDKFGEGIYIHLGDITPEPFVAMAETKDPENIPLNVKFVSTMRVVNPYRWLFSSPKDVNDQVVKRQNSVLRAWVRSGDQNHAQSARGNGSQLWSDLLALNCKPVFDKIENDWGLKILKNSIIVEDVGFDPDYQAALKAKSQAKLQVRASIEETTVRVMLAVAIELGMTADELQEKLKTDPNFSNTAAYKEALTFAKDMVKRDRAGAAGELTDIRVGNADGTSLRGNGLLLAASTFFGGGGGRGNRGKGSGGKHKKPQDMTDDEALLSAMNDQ